MTSGADTSARRHIKRLVRAEITRGADECAIYTDSAAFSTGWVSVARFTSVLAAHDARVLAQVAGRGRVKA